MTISAADEARLERIIERAVTRVLDARARAASSAAPPPTTTLCLKEAAAHIGFSTKTLRRLVNAGAIDVVRPTGKRGTLRFRTEDLDELLRTR